MDERFRTDTGFAIGELFGRRFHEPGGRSDQRPADPPVERQFDAAHRVDDDAGGIGRIPHFQLELAMQWYVAEGRAFQPDVAELAVGEPGHVVAGADMRLGVGQDMVELAGHGAGLGELLGFQPFPFQYVEKIGIAAELSW